jgi:uncharacterized protein DUF6312
MDMALPRVSGSVRRIIQLQRDENGAYAPITLYRKEARKRKVSGPLRPVEKAVRKIASAQVAFANSYVDRHNRSNEKRRDGWMIDLVPNVAEAGRRSTKKLRPE